jgi:hypothetical protein
VGRGIIGTRGIAVQAGPPAVRVREVLVVAGEGDTYTNSVLPVPVGPSERMVEIGRFGS